MHLARTGIAHHLHDFHGRRPAHDRIIDEHDAFARDDRAIGAMFQTHAQLAAGLERLNESAADIVIADNAEFKGNAGILREAERRWHAGIRDGNDDIGLDRRLMREFGAHRLANSVNGLSVHD